ncbi:putative glycerol-3-phosphate cytidylyltransferase [Staphylococcus epidermidis NIHLM021]|nr:putative glycerol-3-phosphate cytidylyltransferase [Staphylococcus epidermidis NIHLM039]EJE07382.1 putative glycerol-3-phosphate cytidylyltransferase [Staphylococcus epidermidis NIHLM021]EJE20940.1 putative glycerol-3-phosphate cytidylyltransferase [Staphylococcus epidermidis NIHLM008]
MVHMTCFIMVILNYLEELVRWGDYLIVALSTDEFNQIKNKKSYYDYEQRKMMLESIRYVDLVIPEEGWGQKEKDVDRFDVDVFVMGHDWEGEFDFLKDKCEVIYLNRTEGISTTKIKQELYGKDTK